MKVKKMIQMIALFVITYVVQFIIVPRILPDYFPKSNEATGLFWGVMIAAVVIGICFVTDKAAYWMISDLLYFLLIWINPADGAYGIGMNGITLDGTQSFFKRDTLWISIIVLAVFILILEFSIKATKNLILKLKH